MSNLGAYQVMTTLARKAGGSIKLGLLIFAGGAATYGVGEVGVKAIAKKLRRTRNKVRYYIYCF